MAKLKRICYGFRPIVRSESDFDLTIRRGARQCCRRRARLPSFPCMDASDRRRRAGESLEDYCRVCKTDRFHTIIAVDADGRPIRVSCGHCHSDHNYRGGPRVGSTPTPSTEQGSLGSRRLSGVREHESRINDREPFPIVSERERTSRPVIIGNDDLELLLRRIIREESGITPVAPAEKWRHGTFVLRPGTPGLQEKSWPIETFFHKIVMLRNRLRTLEQQVNAAELPDAMKVKLQAYISGCYGSLTSFNVLFADDQDHFKGTGGD